MGVDYEIGPYRLYVSEREDHYSLHFTVSLDSPLKNVDIELPKLPDKKVD